MPEVTITPKTVYTVDCSCGRRWTRNSAEEAEETKRSHEEWHEKYGPGPHRSAT